MKRPSESSGSTLTDVDGDDVDEGMDDDWGGGGSKG